MSNDYAALITTVILAALLIGSVQTYTLFRRWASVYTDVARLYVDATNRSRRAIQQGEEPDPADTDAIIEILAKPRRFIYRSTAALLAVSVWVAVCTTLVIVQIDVLKWAATGQSTKDPSLARLSFYVAAGAVVLLVAEGVIRVLFQAGSSLVQAFRDYEVMTGEERDKFFRTVSARVASTHTSSADGGPASDGDAANST
ncbi:hypothetical protein ACIPIU_06065 [Streptomyces massasporeus]|uniref:hypothetical protein n=1 Tax=Streptomyces massasporeus TaxID=67324 RepID=UPI0038082FBB